MHLILFFKRRYTISGKVYSPHYLRGTKQWYNQARLSEKEQCKSGIFSNSQDILDEAHIYSGYIIPRDPPIAGPMRNTPTFIISTADIDLAGWTVSARLIQKHPPGAKQWIESETARRTRPKCPWRREVGLKWRWKNKPRWGRRLKKDQRSLFPVPGDDRQHHGQWSWHPTLRPERGVQVRHLAPLWMSPNCWLQMDFFLQGIKSDREPGSIWERLLQQAQYLHPFHQPGDFPVHITPFHLWEGR